MSEPTIKAVAEGAGGGSADVHAHAGQAIRGNLYRGGTGQFQAGPAAQLQKRLEAIRAKRAAKGKGKGKKKAGGKGKGKKPAKPKLTPADKLAARKEKVAANRTAAIAEMANRDAGLAPAGAANLLKLADGGAVEGAAGDALVKMGLAEQSKTDDKYRLTPAGRSAAGALGRGDADGAIRAVNKAGDAQAKRQGKQAAAQAKKQERAKAAKERVKAKAGARKKEKQAKPAEKQHAKPAPKKEAAPAAPAEKAPSPAEKAKNRTAALDKMTDKPNAESLATLDKLASGGKADPDFAASLADETGLVEKGKDGSYTVSAEGKRLLDALDKGDAKGAASALADGQSKLAAAATAPKKPAKPAQALPAGPRRQTATKGTDMADYDTILDNLTTHGEALAELIDDDGAIKAGARHSGNDNKLIQGIYDAAEDICELAEALGAAVADEETEEEDAGDMGEMEGKAADEDIAPGIEFAGDDLAVSPGSAVKALDDGEGWVGGYLVRFGGDGDLSSYKDIFTKATDYGRASKSDVYVHHRMLPGVGKRRLTNQADIGVDDEGVFIKHLLNLRSSYERKLYEDMVKQGKMGWSSGTAPHLVERKATDDGRHVVEQWPLGLDASYTPMPAGGLDVGATALKSLFADAGIDLLNAIYDNPEATDDQDRESADGQKAASDERARRLLIELDLLQLETIT